MLFRSYTLDEIPNAVTKKTAACFEPVLDYVVVKMPKFPFDKFVYAKRDLGTQMKATGEVMAIGQTFEQAIMKAVRGAEVGAQSLNLSSFVEMSDEEIEKRVGECTDQRIFAIFQAIKRNILSIIQINKITKIDLWFLAKLENLAFMERDFAKVKAGEKEFTPELYKAAKNAGYPDKVIQELAGQKITGASGILSEAKEAAKLVKQGKVAHIPAVYKMVDTCAGEFNAETPYFYGTYDSQNEARIFLDERKEKGKKSSKGTIIVLGSGPIRIGQGIEFDYASVQCVWALKRLG